MSVLPDFRVREQMLNQVQHDRKLLVTLNLFQGLFVGNVDFVSKVVGFVRCIYFSQTEMSMLLDFRVREQTPNQVQHDIKLLVTLNLFQGLLNVCATGFQSKKADAEPSSA